MESPLLSDLESSWRFFAIEDIWIASSSRVLECGGLPFVAWDGYSSELPRIYIVISVENSQLQHITRLTPLSAARPLKVTDSTLGSHGSLLPGQYCPNRYLGYLGVFC